MPVLVRRIVAELQPFPYVEVQLARKVSRSAVVLPNGIEDAVKAIAREVGHGGAILVLLDADDDCPALLGPALLARAMRAASHLPIAVVLAMREYEAWFLAAATSLGNQRGLESDLLPPSDTERIRDAKGWLSKRMPAGKRYKETADQPALTALFDMATARAMSDSFDKCYRAISGLVASLTDPER